MIITVYPIWFLIFCIAAGVAYSGILYYRNKNQDYTKKLLWIMSALRFVCITLISFLLLSPLWKTNDKTTENPIIILAQDNSTSLILNKDSAYYRTQYQKDIQKFADKISEKYEVIPYLFGSQTTAGEKIPDFTDKTTDISAFLDDIRIRYANRNVGAVVLASDGIYNAGINPIYAYEKINHPLYTLALGDTTIRKDLLINEIECNHIAYLGNDFMMAVSLQAFKSQGQKAVLTVEKEGKQLFYKEIAIDNERFVYSENILLNADKSGLQRYKVSLKPLENESTIANNTQYVFVDVLDGRQKVLLLSSAPHPDMSALKNSIENNPNYEVETYFTYDFNKAVQGYNLVIAYQLPDISKNGLAVINSAFEKGIPVLFAMGQKNDINAFNALGVGLNIIRKKDNLNEVTPAIEKEFSLFTFSDPMEKVTGNFPPLLAPFGDYKIQGSTQVFITQRIGNLKTDYPLIAFNTHNNLRVGMITGEGLWKWRLHNYLQNGTHSEFDELINKIVQYLVLKADRSFFRIQVDKLFNETQAITFQAELYNDSYELINTPDIQLTVTSSDGKKYNYTFGRTTSAYTLDIGRFPVGEYTYEANVKHDSKTLTQKGKITISALNIEEINLIADHGLLHTLAQKNSGTMFYPNQLDQLAQTLLDREDIKPVSYYHIKNSEWIKMPWALLLLISLLTIEWVMRKYNGGY